MNAQAFLSPSDLQQRDLDINDLATVHALHLRSTASLGNDMVRNETRESMAQLMHKSRVTGLFHGDELVAYGVLQHQLDADERLPESLTPDPTRPQLALAGISVSPQWRGHSLQRRLIMQRIAMAPADALLFSTAAPANHYSWNNLLDCGFHVRDIGPRHGGQMRYLMVLEPLPEYALYPDLSKEIHALDIKRQHQLLQEGWRGAQPGHRAEYLRYIPVKRRTV